LPFLRIFANQSQTRKVGDAFTALDPTVNQINSSVMHRFFRYTSPLHLINFGAVASIVFVFVGEASAAEESARDESLKLLHETLRPPKETPEPEVKKPTPPPKPEVKKPTPAPKPEVKKPAPPPKPAPKPEAKKPVPPPKAAPKPEMKKPLPLPEASPDPVVEEPLLLSDTDEVAELEFLDLELPSEDEGFYPTIEETMLLGGDYPRSAGGKPNNPPDRLMQTAQGIYPYPNPGQLERAPWAESLSPLNPFLGFFAPRQALISEGGGDWPRGLTLDIDSSFPLLVRDFSPERAMLKVGPTYFDMLFVGMTVLHSDYQGDQNFAKGAEDGWLMGIEFGLRGIVQFTDQFYLSLAGTLVYIPLDNELGIRLGSGGAPTAIADLNYQFEQGTWDYRFYNNFSASAGYDVFADLEHGALDRAGRYSFGFDDRRRRASGYYDGENAYFINALGFEASSPVWEDWRLWISGKRLDYWRTWDFEDHTNINSLRVRLGYNGSELRFAPYLEYNLDHYNDDDTLANRIYFGIRGRINENLSLRARAGYLWWDHDSDGGGIEDGYLYSVALFHELSRYTSHSLSAGQDYYNDDLTGDRTVASYVRYAMNHTFTRSLSAVSSIQYSKQDGRFYDGERTNITSVLRYAFCGGHNSAIALRAAYEHRTGKFRGDRWLGRASYTRRLFSRAMGEVFYQYEEASGAPSYNEQLFGFTLREYF
jgi:outer membrane biosynthesis protein TonB